MVSTKNQTLIELRKSLEMNQEEFGNYLGVAKSTISYWENGGTPSGKRIVDVSRKLGLNFGHYFFGSHVQES